MAVAQAPISALSGGFALRAERPVGPRDHVATFHQSVTGMVHLCFDSPGCRFSLHGDSCIMCDYGRGHELSAEDVHRYFSRGPHKERAAIVSADCILVGSHGSIFDSAEIPPSVLDAILEALAALRATCIIFETHYTTVDAALLKRARSALDARDLVIEMGLESADRHVLHDILHKPVDLVGIEHAIDTAHSCGFGASLNVLLGSPGLAPHEQLSDSLDTIRWAFDHGADSVVLFPVNVKPFTPLYGLYAAGKYTPPSQWLLIELLSLLEAAELERLTLSWYGERGGFYGEGVPANVPPSSCPVCRDELESFYVDFLRAGTGAERKSLIGELFHGKHCACCSGTDTR